MDLKNGKILMKELAMNPKAKAIILKEFPMINNQVIRLSFNMPLSQVLALVRSFDVPQNKINHVLQELKKL